MLVISGRVDVVGVDVEVDEADLIMYPKIEIFG